MKWLIVLFVFSFHSSWAQAWRIMIDKGAEPPVTEKASELVPVQHAGAKLLLPTTDSVWALTGWMDGYKSYRTVLHNLQTGSSGEPVKHEADVYTFSRLSPDGRHLIGRHRLQRGWTIAVWETRTGKVVWMDREGEGILPWNDFLDDERLIEVSGSYMKVWNFKTNKLEHKITPVDGLGVSGSVFTPTRKFLARLETGGTIRLYSMPEGNLAGELPPPDIGGRKIETAYMDVSQDGLELAVAMRVSSKPRDVTDNRWIIASWDLRTGKQTARHELERDLVASLNSLAAGYEIDCLPDRTGWLFRGAGLIERTSGQLVWAVPRPSGIRRVEGSSLFLPRGRLLVQHSGGRNGAHKLHAVRLPTDIPRRLADLKAKRELPDLKAALVSKSNRLAGTDWPVVHKRTAALKAFPASQRKPITNEALGRALKGVYSDDPETSNAALEVLGKATPDPKQATRVTQAIRTVATKGKHPFYTTAGWWVIGQWEKNAGPSRPAAPPHTAVVPGGPGPRPRPVPSTPGTGGTSSDVEGDLTSGDFSRVVRAMRRLETQGDAKAALLLAQHYEKNRALAGHALRQIGADAAPAIPHLLKSKEWSVRIEGLRLLETYGTKAELAAVRALEADPNRLVQMKAKETAAAIGKRSK